MGTYLYVLYVPTVSLMALAIHLQRITKQTQYYVKFILGNIKNCFNLFIVIHLYDLFIFLAQ